MPYVTTRDGTTLYVKDWGAGRPVILIHGWPLSADSWDDQALALADAGLRVIAYDRRGFGRSSQPWKGYDYDTLADDLAAVMEASNAREAALVGFSMGGGEVARYLSRHGGKNVAQAVLVSTVVPLLVQKPDHPEGVPEAELLKILDGIQHDRAAFWSTFFKQFYGEGLLTKPVSDELLAWSAQMAMMASLKATLACAQSFGMTDFRGELSAFRVPTLVIHGTADKTVPIAATGKLAAAGIAGATFKPYDGAPHGLFATHKQQLTRDLLQFLKG